MPDKLHATAKGFSTFNKSAHSLISEEPERVKEVLIQDLLNRITALAD
jgi:hypothetical protein